ncbi:MAG: hypothetical protein R3287_13345 [Anderseniella sp.]|jgi:hypothetical protein|nr:hypothetical protein [Anderseniella sp.]
MTRWLNALVLSAAAAMAGSAPSLADPNCRCRLYGEYFDIGSVMCIRGKLRRCEMNQNNTSWKQIGDICPQARFDDALPDQPRRAYAARLGSSIPSPE